MTLIGKELNIEALEITQYFAYYNYKFIDNVLT